MDENELPSVIVPRFERWNDPIPSVDIPKNVKISKKRKKQESLFQESFTNNPLSHSVRPPLKKVAPEIKAAKRVENNFLKKWRKQDAKSQSQSMRNLTKRRGPLPEAGKKVLNEITVPPGWREDTIALIEKLKPLPPKAPLRGEDAVLASRIVPPTTEGGPGLSRAMSTPVFDPYEQYVLERTTVGPEVFGTPEEQDDVINKDGVKMSTEMRQAMQATVAQNLGSGFHSDAVASPIAAPFSADTFMSTNIGNPLGTSSLATHSFSMQRTLDPNEEMDFSNSGFLKNTQQQPEMEQTQIMNENDNGEDASNQTNNNSNTRTSPSDLNTNSNDDALSLMSASMNMDSNNVPLPPSPMGMRKQQSFSGVTGTILPPPSPLLPSPTKRQESFFPLYNTQSTLPPSPLRQTFASVQSSNSHMFSTLGPNGALMRPIFPYSQEAHDAARLIARTWKQRLWRREAHVITLQRVYRGWQSRKKYLEHKNYMTRVVIAVQAVVRGLLGRREAIRRRNIRDGHMAVKIQKIWRARMGRQHFAECWDMRNQNCATRIQAMYRARKAREYVYLLRGEKHMDAVMLLQRMMRGHKVRKEVRAYKKRFFAALMLIQRYVIRWRIRRRKRAALIIQKRCLKPWIAKKLAAHIKMQCVGRKLLANMRARKERSRWRTIELRRLVRENEIVLKQESATMEILDGGFLQSPKGQKAMMEALKTVKEQRRIKRKRWMQDLPKEYKQAAFARERLEALDIPGRGHIDADQFKQFVKNMMITMSKTEINEHFTELDKAKTGLVPIQDVAQWIQDGKAKSKKSRWFRGPMKVALAARRFKHILTNRTTRALAKRQIVGGALIQTRDKARDEYREGEEKPNFICPNCQKSFALWTDRRDHLENKLCLPPVVRCDMELGEEELQSKKAPALKRVVGKVKIALKSFSNIHPSDWNWKPTKNKFKKIGQKIPLLKRAFKREPQIAPEELHPKISEKIAFIPKKRPPGEGRRDRRRSV